MAFTSSGKASGEDAVGLGTEAWNIADGYTKIKILRLIIQLDLDEEFALFGKKDDNDDAPPQIRNERRVEYFHKFIFHLRQLIGNCKFAIEKGGYDEKLIKNYEDRIEQIEEVSDGISDIFINDVTKEEELRINQKHFAKCFNILREIKDDLNFPINRAGLIFRQGDELDLDAVMRSVEDGGL